jgi:hypothetical protein
MYNSIHPLQEEGISSTQLIACTAQMLRYLTIANERLSTAQVLLLAAAILCQCAPRQRWCFAICSHSYGTVPLFGRPLLVQVDNADSWLGCGRYYAAVGNADGYVKLGTADAWTQQLLLALIAVTKILIN